MQHILTKNPLEQVLGSSNNKADARSNAKAPETVHESVSLFGGALERAGKELKERNHGLPAESNQDLPVEKNKQAESVGSSLPPSSNTAAPMEGAQQPEILAESEVNLLDNNVSVVDDSFAEKGVASNSINVSPSQKSTEFVQYVLGIKPVDKNTSVNKSNSVESGSELKNAPLNALEGRSKAEHAYDVPRWSIKADAEAPSAISQPQPNSSSESKHDLQKAINVNQTVFTDILSDRDLSLNHKGDVKTVKVGLTGVENAIRDFANEVASAKHEKLTSNELRLSLRPVHLGEVKVEILRENDGVRVNIIASTEEARNHLNQHRENLQSSLSSTLDKGVNVNIGDGSKGGERGESGRDQSSSGGSTHSRSSLDEDTEEIKVYSSTIEIS